MPKKAGGVGSRTLKSENNKSQPLQPADMINIPEQAPEPLIAVPALHSNAQVEQKVWEDANAKELMRNKIKNLAKQLENAHLEIVMLLDKCDATDVSHENTLSQLKQDHLTLVQHKDDIREAALVKKAKHSSAIAELKEKFWKTLERKDEELHSMVQQYLAERKTEMR